MYIAHSSNNKTLGNDVYTTKCASNLQTNRYQGQSKYKSTRDV